MTLITKLGRSVRDQTGANLIEAAIITPLLLLLTFSIVDFGSLFYAYLALENGVSQATRYGVTGNTMTDSSGNAMSRVDSIKAVMRDATPTLTIPDSAFTFEHMTAGSSSWVAGTGQPNDIERLTVAYDWQLLTPVISPFFSGGQIHLQVQSAMKNEGRFQ
jgi:Flp pilus assembly protein TadG